MKRIEPPILRAGSCPRCGARLEMIEGWREYGDRLVEIVVEGCMKCGYLADEDTNDDDEWDLI